MCIFWISYLILFTYSENEHHVKVWDKTMYSEHLSPLIHNIVDMAEIKANYYICK